MFGRKFPEMLALLILGVILFGKDLPNVGRSLGKGLMDFKRSLQGVHDEVSSHLRDLDPMTTPERPRPRTTQRVATTAPKYTEPSEPV